MKDMTVETLNFIILCMGLLFVMAGIFLIVGKLAGKRPASIAVGVLMIAWGLLCGIPESRSWMLARATDLEHLLEAMWAGLDGDGRMLVYIFALWLMGAIYLSSGNLKAPNPHLRQDVDARHSMRSDMARLPIRGMTLNRAWTAYLPRFPVTRVPR